MSAFGLGSGHDRVRTDDGVIQRSAFTGTHLGKRVDVWNCGIMEVWKWWKQGQRTNCTVMGESKRMGPAGCMGGHAVCDVDQMAV